MQLVTVGGIVAGWVISIGIFGVVYRHSSRARNADKSNVR